MFQLIFSVVFLLIAGVFVLVGVLKGRKYAWFYSALKVAAVLLATALSAVLSVLISGALSRFVCDALIHSGILGEVGSTLQDLSTVTAVVSALMAMIIAPGMFFVLFWIIKAILHAIVLRVSAEIAVRTTKTAETETVTGADEAPKSEAERPVLRGRKMRRAAIRAHGVNPLGMLCGALCGFLLCVVILIPAVGACTIADDMIGMVASFSSSDSMIQAADDISNQVNESVGVKTVRAMGGNAIYSYLTTYRVGEERVSLLKETECFSVMGTAVAAVIDSDVNRAEAAGLVVEAKDAFLQTSMLPAVLPELLHSAAESWDRGEAFLGVEKPSLGESLDGIFESTLDILATSDSDTIRSDVGTLAQVFAVIVERDALDTVKDNPMKLFEDEELSSLIVYELLSNEHMSPLVGDVSELGLQMLGDKIGADMSDVELDTSSVTDKRAEADAIAKTLGDAVEILEYVEGHPSVDAQTLRSIGTLLDDLAHTQMAGKQNTDRILVDLLCSEQVYTKIGITREEINSLANTINTNAEKGGYAPLMQSLGHTVEVFQMSTSEDKNMEELDQKVEVLLQDLTPESAEVLKEMTTPSIIQSHGVPEQSAQPTSDMISTMFGNLSDAKESGMSEEEYQKEAKATTDLLNIAMSATKGDGSTIFGEEGSTGKSASELLDNVLESKVISQTMVETVYANGTEEEPVINPLNSEKNLQDSEKQQLLDAMNDKWDQASDEEKSDSGYQKQYVAIGAMLNVSVQVTADGIVIA